MREPLFCLAKGKNVKNQKQDFDIFQAKYIIDFTTKQGCTVRYTYILFSSELFIYISFYHHLSAGQVLSPSRRGQQDRGCIVQV